MAGPSVENLVIRILLSFLFLVSSKNLFNLSKLATFV